MIKDCLEISWCSPRHVILAESEVFHPCVTSKTINWATCQCDVPECRKPDTSDLLENSRRIMYFRVVGVSNLGSSTFNDHLYPILLYYYPSMVV